MVLRTPSLSAPPYRAAVNHITSACAYVPKQDLNCLPLVGSCSKREHASRLYLLGTFAHEALWCHHSLMHRNRFHDADLIRTPSWPAIFALAAALGIIVYVLLRTTT